MKDFAACHMVPEPPDDLGNFPPSSYALALWELGEEYDGGDMNNHQIGV